LPLSLGFWLIRGSALGPIGGLSTRQFCPVEKRRREEVMSPVWRLYDDELLENVFPGFV